MQAAPRTTSKNVPTAAIIHNVFYFDWQCPTCKREYVNATHGVPHCVDCGQRINWEEEE